MIVRIRNKDRNLKKGTRLIRIVRNNYVYIPRKDYFWSYRSNGYNIPALLNVPKTVFKKLKDNGDIQYHFTKDGKEYWTIKE